MTYSATLCYASFMRIVCQQCHYLPWLGYFELLQADRFVFLDSVQWTKQGRHHRTKIYAEGKPQWLSIPVQSAGHRNKTLKDMQVDQSQSWSKHHWELLENAYRNAPEFERQLKPLLKPFLEKMQQEKFLQTISEQSLWLFQESLGFQPELFWSSELPEAGESTERLVSLCQTLGGTEYFSSLGSTRYLDLSLFRAAGIQVRWQHFRKFFPGDIHRPADLSILDWVAHLPLSEIRKILEPASFSRSEQELPLHIENGAPPFAPEHFSQNRNGS